MKRIKLFLLILVVGISSSQNWAQVEMTTAAINEAKIEARQARINHFLDRIRLEPEKLSKLLNYTGKLRTRYEVILRTQTDLENFEPSGESENVIAAYQNLEQSLEIVKEQYSESLSSALDYVVSILNQDQLEMLYRYLYDELWYEGLIKSTIVTNPISAGTAHEAFGKKVDFQTFIQKYGENELAELYEKMIEWGAIEEPDAEVQIQTEQDRKYRNDLELHLKPLIEPDSVVFYEESRLSSEPGDQEREELLVSEPPPWLGTSLGSVTLDRIRYLFEGQHPHIVKFYLIDLSMTAEKMLRNRTGF